MYCSANGDRQMFPVQTVRTWNSWAVEIITGTRYVDRVDDIEGRCAPDSSSGCRSVPP